MKNKEVLILHSCDEHHTWSSMRLLACFSDLNELMIYCTNFLDKDDLRALKEDNQTQGRTINYLVLTEKLNPEYE